MPTIAFAWVGCKLNRYEIQAMSESLGKQGFITVPFSQAADCYVVNTCTVTNDADISSRQVIRRARRRAPESKVIVTGCYAQLQPQDLRDLGVDAIISNSEKEKLPREVLRLFGYCPDNRSIEGEGIITRMDGMTRAFVKIQDGCDEQCTFCTIWMARGSVRSRPPEIIIKEVNKLSESGFKEIVLTGVHIGKYGYGRTTFIELIRDLIERTTIARIRLSSMNPVEVTSELLELMAGQPRLCPHLHLSIQSGDDDILSAMGRKYRSNDISAIVKRIIAAIPHATIGADFITGFPGEGRFQFENTRRLIEQLEIHHLHIFTYSDRPGTKACLLPDKIDPMEKAARTKILRELGENKKLLHLRKFIGKKLHVLFENREMRISALMTGLSENYLRVNSLSSNGLRGKIVEVIPDSIENNILLASTFIGIGKSEKG